MITRETARKIGINACIDSLGRDFVKANKQYAAFAYSEFSNAVYCFVGVDDGPSNTDKSHMLMLDSTSAFQYKAHCVVALKDGSVTFVNDDLPLWLVPTFYQERI